MPALILLVDDDVEQLSVLGGMLSDLPCNLETAMTGSRALEMLSREVPAVVITDMVMPEVSGSEIIHAIRSDPRLESTRIIIVTSLMKYVSEEDGSMADAVLIKPVKKDELENLVREMMS